MTADALPKWARELERFLPVKSQFVLWGNVYDVYPLDLAGTAATLKMLDYLKTLLTQNGYQIVCCYEPLKGFQLLAGEPEEVKKLTGETIVKEKPLSATLGKAADFTEKLLTANTLHSAVILNFASRLADIGGNDTQEFYYRMFSLSHRAIPLLCGQEPYPKYNVAVWILDKENDIPAWYTLDNTKVKSLSIPKPDYGLRKQVIENLSRNIAGYQEMNEKKRQETLSLFIDRTSGLHASEIVSIVSLARRESVTFPDIDEAVRMYKLGIVENPWSKLDVNKIGDAENILARRVKGQPDAVRKASDVLKRAVFNLSGAQYTKFSQRPKGVLFFAGPTGVGKTELAKSVTELIFGSETSYIRFDMSEFAREHADQRLVGAPPGYVGYDVGGELTNAVKQNPFCVILFDEIEKAHPKILDIFLQILDDGRLTSGRGETVYFTEALIIFTSNLGIHEVTPEGKKVQRVTPDMSCEDISAEILHAIEDFFKYKIGRPEILNRIGDNVVVFDFIRPDIAVSILDKMLGNVLEKLGDVYGLTIEVQEKAGEKLKEVCCMDLSMGGRGIGNKLETAFINPLSRGLFMIDTKEGDSLIVREMIDYGQTWQLVVERKG